MARRVRITSPTTTEDAIRSTYLYASPRSVSAARAAAHACPETEQRAKAAAPSPVDSDPHQYQHPARFVCARASQDVGGHARRKTRCLRIESRSQRGGRSDAAGSSFPRGTIEEPGYGAAATHPRLLIERTGCGPPSPLPATLASLGAKSIAFCKSFTFPSPRRSASARILACGEDEPVRWARPLSRKHAAATWAAHSGAACAAHRPRLAVLPEQRRAQPMRAATWQR